MRVSAFVLLLAGWSAGLATPVAAEEISLQLTIQPKVCSIQTVDDGLSQVTSIEAGCERVAPQLARAPKPLTPVYRPAFSSVVALVALGGLRHMSTLL